MKKYFQIANSLIDKRSEEGGCGEDVIFGLCVDNKGEGAIVFAPAFSVVHYLGGSKKSPIFAILKSEIVKGNKRVQIPHRSRI
jgi:hypothetical protein